MNVYINLGDLMKKKGITAVELAKKTGMSPEHLSVIKNGKTKRIDLDTIEQLLLHLDTEPNELFKYK